MPTLEALHAEVPVITSDRSSMPEVAGPAALLVDPESAAGRKQREKYSWAASARLVYEQIVLLRRANQKQESG